MLSNEASTNFNPHSSQPNSPEKQSKDPQEWWHHFNLDYHKLYNNPLKLFRRLSRAIEKFKPDLYRKDDTYVRIWLCYLEAHFSLYKDEEEMKVLFRFLKGEHVGARNEDFILKYAQFELQSGKPKKCLAMLHEAEAEVGGEKIKRALMEYKMISSFRVESSLPKTPIPPMTPSSSFMETKSKIQDSHFTPIAPGQQTGNVTVELPSTQRFTGKIKRLGLSGPPKRSLSQTGIDSEERLEEQAQNENFTDEDSSKNNMSLTTISPSNIRESNPIIIPPESTRAPSAKVTFSKSKAVRVNDNNYKILQMIGRGGSSKVFRVIDTENNIHALKVVNLRGLDDTTMCGYLNEIDLLESFKDSSSIITLLDYEVNREHQNLYMLMECGEADLGRLLRGKSNQTNSSNNSVGLGGNLNFIRYVWQQMLLAVHTVHAAKIVHCDLKPANFLLVAGRLKLIDFGISKAILNDTTNIVRENQVGTVNYMSPEALQESSSSEKGRIKIGRASDVWSLGCILYEMVYGTPPFAQYSLIQRLHKILDPNYQIPFPETADPSVVSVIKSCLQRNIKERISLSALLEHPFISGKIDGGREDADHVFVSKDQIVGLLKRFAKHFPSMDPLSLADKVIHQWRKDNNGHDSKDKRPKIDSDKSK